LIRASICADHDATPMRRSHPKPPEVCPVCGEDVPARALACPECGADHNSGWREDIHDGIDLPDEEFDYDEFVRNEFGASPVPKGIRPIWWVAGIVLLLALALLFLRL
jgi:hypothetical protein